METYGFVYQQTLHGWTHKKLHYTANTTQMDTLGVVLYSKHYIDGDIRSCII